MSVILFSAAWLASISIFAFATASSTQSSAVAVGAQAPAVALDSVVAGTPQKFSLSDELKKGPVVLYFFPKAFTGGCTIEARVFGQQYDTFAKLGYEVVGISTDDVPTLTKFQKAEDAKQRFVSDPAGVVAKAFGIAQDYKGQTFAGRVTFVIGVDDTVQFEVADDVPQSNIQSTLDWVKKHPVSRGAK